jgi:hydroxymethylpyrimidine/phosphomethylpyrimidine kinase
MDRENGSLAMSGPWVLIIAGSDSSGGAGIVRDVETVAIRGLKTAIAVTAVTAQSDRRVTAVQAMEPALVTAQMEAALEGGDIGAVKIGMLAHAGIVAAVADVLARHPTLPVVLDPVLASTSGKVLLEPDGMRLMIERLLPRADLVTPNLPELALLTGTRDFAESVEALVQLGIRAALIKGGHAEDHVSAKEYRLASAHLSDAGICSDLLVCPGLPAIQFDAPRLPGTLRGTGCMLASAIACGLATGRDMEACIREAKAYVTQVFREGQREAISAATRSSAG